MAKGDIVLIPFPFTDLSGNKLRPAVVLAETTLDFTLCFITSQTSWLEPTDILLAPSQNNGLKKPSLVRTSKLATLDKQLAVGLLGQLSQAETDELNIKLKQVFQLP